MTRFPRPLRERDIGWQTVFRSSVARESQKVPGVVEEFVDVGVRTEHRYCSLVVSDEVVGDQREHRDRGQSNRGGQNSRRRLQVDPGDGADGVGITHRRILTCAGWWSWSCA